MPISIDWGALWGIVQHDPWSWVLFSGLFSGMALTQLVKQAWVVYGDTTLITEKRFTFTVRLFSALATYLFTLWIWHSFIVHSGIEEAACLAWGVSSPLIYDGLRAVIAWKFPDFAAALGKPDNVTFKDTPK